MAKMTAEQIETVITQEHANVLAVTQVTREERVIDRALTTALRSCFVAGVDQGKAEVFERATDMLVQQVADERTVQLGRSMSIILQWCRLIDGRIFTGTGATYACVMRSESEPKSEDGFHSQYAHGSDTNEALSKLATWCSEHMVSSECKTEPSPQMEPEEVSELCDNRATVDAAMQKSELDF